MRKTIYEGTGLDERGELYRDGSKFPRRLQIIFEGEHVYAWNPRRIGANVTVYHLSQGVTLLYEVNERKISVNVFGKEHVIADTERKFREMEKVVKDTDDATTSVNPDIIRKLEEGLQNGSDIE